MQAATRLRPTDWLLDLTIQCRQRYRSAGELPLGVILTQAHLELDLAFLSRRVD